MSSVQYNIDNDFAGELSTSKLCREIQNENDIEKNLTHLTKSEDVLNIHFHEECTQDEINVLNNIVQNHDGSSHKMYVCNFVDAYKTDDNDDVLQPGIIVSFTGQNQRIKPCEVGDEPVGVTLDINDIMHIVGIPKYVTEEDGWNIVGFLGKFPVKNDESMFRSSWIKIEDDVKPNHNLYVFI